MSVDEMCKLVSKQTADANPCRLTGKEVLDITAALRAGQRMRRYLREEEEFEVHLRCCQAWDAATKGDV